MFYRELLVDVQRFLELLLQLKRSLGAPRIKKRREVLRDRAPGRGRLLGEMSNSFLLWESLDYAEGISWESLDYAILAEGIGWESLDYASRRAVKKALKLRRATIEKGGDLSTFTLAKVIENRQHLQQIYVEKLSASTDAELAGDTAGLGSPRNGPPMWR